MIYIFHYNTAKLFYAIMMSFIADELKNIIAIFLNYCNNNYLRNLWFKYIDYYNINSICDNNYILINHIMLVIIVFTFFIVKMYYIYKDTFISA